MTGKSLTIVAFGDSITAAAEQAPENRWPAMLEAALRERFPGIDLGVINAGVGGNTTREGLARIEPDVLRHNPDLVLVEFGNDVTDEAGRHVAYDEFTANLDLIRVKVAERSNARTVPVVFTPIIDARHTAAFPLQKAWRNGGQDAAQEHYRRLTRQFASTRGLPLVDADRALRGAMNRGGGGECIRPDGVHLTGQGNRVVARAAREIVAAEVEAIVRAKT